MTETQREVHQWGRVNRVIFDASKEKQAIVHPRDGEGESFKLLGNIIDPKLTMDQAVQHILSKDRPKITAMLRTRGKYSHADMFMQYKTHIWGHAEYQNGCIAHAAPSTLLKIDSMQRRYLHELSITEQVAFLDHNFAPPCLRRDIGMLGLIHKRILGLAHPAYEQLLPMASQRWYDDQYHYPRHDKQIDNGMDQCIYAHNMFNRSIFGRVVIYNRLSQRIVDCTNISTFQHELTELAKAKCERGENEWQYMFSPVTGFGPDAFV